MTGRRRLAAVARRCSCPAAGWVRRAVSRGAGRAGPRGRQREPAGPAGDLPRPRPGAGQESIVRGFVRAGAASDAAYDNARAFLIPEVSEKWDPDGTIVLLADDVPPTATLLDPATVRITAAAAGTVDADGRYTAARPGSTVSATFRLQTVSGEWRIAELPKGFGRWISSDDVSRLVQPYALHYVATSRRASSPTCAGSPPTGSRPGSPAPSSRPCPSTSSARPSPPFPTAPASSGTPCRSSRASRASTSSRAGSAPGRRTGRTCGRSSSAPCCRTPRCRGWRCRSTACRSTWRSSTGSPAGTAGSLADIGFPAPPVASWPGRSCAAVTTSWCSTRLPSGSRSRACRPGRGSYPPVRPDVQPPRAVGRRDGARRRSTPAATASRGGAGSTATRCRSTASRSVTPRTTGGASCGRVPSGPVARTATRLWVVDGAADPAGPPGRRHPVEVKWLAGRRVLEARVAPDGDRVAVLSTLADGSDSRVDLGGVVRTGGGRAAAARRRRCGSGRR